MNGENSTQIDINTASGVADTLMGAANSFGTLSPFSSVSGIQTLQNAGISTAKAVSFDAGVAALSVQLASIVNSMKAYVEQSNGIDQVNDDDLESETEEDNKEDEDLEGVDDDNTDDQSGKKAAGETGDDATNIDKQQDGDNTSGTSGTYDDGTKDEKKKDLIAANADNETDKQDYKDGTEDEKKKDLEAANADNETEQKDLDDVGKGTKKKPLAKPKTEDESKSPDEVVKDCIKDISSDELATILNEFNKNESGEIITLNEIMANEAYMDKLKSIIKNNSKFSDEFRDNIMKIDDKDLKKILLDTLKKGDINSTSSNLATENFKYYLKKSTNGLDLSSNSEQTANVLRQTIANYNKNGTINTNITNMLGMDNKTLAAAVASLLKK